MASELARELGFDLSELTAYADSGHDVPLLLAVGKAVAVRPDERLAAEARSRGWEMLGEVRRGLLRGLVRPASAAVPRPADGAEVPGRE
jgi:phosphoserine phosphatase